MSTPSQSFARPTLTYTPLTIIEVETPRPAPVLGSNRIYFFAAAGTALGVLFGVAVATSNLLPRWLPMPNSGVSAAVAAAAAGGPRGPRKFGSVNAIAAGLKGRLTTDWKDKPFYQLDIEPSDLTQLPGFARAVADSPRPLSVAFQLLDSTGTVLCGQEVILRYDAARAAARHAAVSSLGSADDPSLDPATRLQVQEQAREHGRDMFDIEIGGDGKIEAINAQGQMVCSKQAYEKAVSWNLSPDFPSIAEQDELLKGADPTTAPKPATVKKVSSAKASGDARSLSAALDGFLIPKDSER